MSAAGDLAEAAALAAQLEAETVRSGADPWADSPFRWIRALAPRTKGKVGEQMSAQLVTARGVVVTDAATSDADRVFDKVPVEIKTSTLWDTGTYRFQQIRPAQAWDVLWCLGLSPHAVHCWAIPKQTAVAHAIGQHSGQSASETMWLEIDPAALGGWLAPYGASVDRAVAALAAHHTG